MHFSTLGSTQTLLYLVAFTTVCAFLSWAHARRLRPSRYFPLGTVGLAVTSLLPTIYLEHFTTAEGMDLLLHDTYYVSVNLHAFLAQCLAFFIFAAVFWGQERFGAMYYPQATRWLFWPLFLSISIGNLSWPITHSAIRWRDQFVDYAEWISVANQAAATATYVSWIVTAIILFLIIWSGFKRWRNPPM